MMSKSKIAFLLVVVCLLASGCIPQPTSYQSSYQYSKQFSSPEEKKPIFLGWDENGYKVYDTDAKTGKTAKVNQETITEKADIKGKKADIKSNKKPYFILNEDAILCETDVPLLDFYPFYIYPNGRKQILSGKTIIVNAKLAIDINKIDLMANENHK